MTEEITLSMTAGTQSLSSQDRLLLTHRDSIPVWAFDKTELKTSNKSLIWHHLTCSLLADDLGTTQLEVLAVQQLDVPEAAGELRDVRVPGLGEAREVDMENIVPCVQQPLRLFGVTLRVGPSRDIRKDVWIPRVELELYHWILIAIIAENCLFTCGSVQPDISESDE